MIRLLTILAALLLAVPGFAQDAADFQSNGTVDPILASGTISTAQTFTGRTLFHGAPPTPPKPAKKVCAFGLSVEYISVERPSKYERFSGETYGIRRIVHEPVCPYERAVEMFGAEAVDYAETDTHRFVLVDGEAVYYEAKPRVVTFSGDGPPVAGVCVMECKCR